MWATVSSKEREGSPRAHSEAWNGDRVPAVRQLNFRNQVPARWLRATPCSLSGLQANCHPCPVYVPAPSRPPAPGPPCAVGTHKFRATVMEDWPHGWLHGLSTVEWRRAETTRRLYLREYDSACLQHCIRPSGLGTHLVKVTMGMSSSPGRPFRRGKPPSPGLFFFLRRMSHANSSKRIRSTTCLWSHAGGQRVHIHDVVQPVTKEQVSMFAARGLNLQVAQFALVLCLIRPR